MLNDTLYIKYLDAQGNEQLFPNASMPAKIQSYTFNAQRMGGAPSLTATLSYHTCLDNQWTRKEYVEFRGEKYYILDIPSSSKDNSDFRFKHSITFTSERRILDNTFFLDVVTTDTDANYIDRPRSNDTKLTFYGDINEFAARLTDSMVYSGLCRVTSNQPVKTYDGYHVVVDEGVTSDTFELSFDSKYLSEAIREIFDTFGLTYYFVGKTCHVGDRQNAIDDVFEYGEGIGLLSVARNNANYKYFDRITGTGSGDNIPYYYPNDTEEGTIRYTGSIDASNIENIILSKLNANGIDVYNDTLTWVNANKTVVYPSTRSVRLQFSGTGGTRVSSVHTFSYSVRSDLPGRFDINPSFSVADPADGTVQFRIIGAAQDIDGYYIQSPGGNTAISFQIEVTVLITLPALESSGARQLADYTTVTALSIPSVAWRKSNNALITYDNAGIVLFRPDEMVTGTTITFQGRDWITPTQKLMPSIYRNSLGKERFYNAVDMNDTGTMATETLRGVDPDIYKLDNGDYIQFNNEYIYGEQHEGKQGFDDIRPSIKGMVNASDEPIDHIVAVGFDDDDDDTTTKTDSNSEKYNHPYFYIKLNRFDGEYGFNLFDYGLAGENAYIEMTSGPCAGCRFEIAVLQENVGRYISYNPVQVDQNGDLVSGDYLDKTCSSKSDLIASQQDTTANSVWIAIKKDNETFGVIMPNATNHYRPLPGDSFVITGIKMPKSYVTAAEKRLDKALINYMKENNDDKFSFAIKFSRIYLQTHQDIADLLNENATLIVRYNNIDTLLYVSSYSCKSDDNILTEVSVELTDTLSSTTSQMQKQLSGAKAEILAAFDANNIINAAGKTFLRKDVPDRAAGKITFEKGIYSTDAEFGDNFSMPEDYIFGAGAKIDSDGNGYFGNVYVRGALRAAELVFNQIRAEGGEKIENIGYGEILTVDEENRKATLKLDGDEWATIDAGDICRGLYNTIGKDYTTDDEGEDANGFRTKAGFFASYFTITSVTKNAKGECEFTYDLQPGTTEHPCPLMKFAVYGNFDDTKKERQSSIYTTAVGIAPRQLYLARVNDWQIKPQNIKIAKGNIDGLQVYEKDADGNPVLKTLYGDAGLFVEDNIYFGGILNQFSSADWDYIQSKLGQGIHAQLLRGSDNIVVDALGNVVGGIYEEFGDGTTVNKRYKLHTGVLVYDSGKEQYLKASEAATLADDEYRIYHVCDGCTVLRDGSDFYITGIDNTNDGLSGTVLTDDQLDIMRDTEGCSINFIIVTANGWRTQISYHVKITHLDYSYVTFDLTNEMDSITYRTQTKRYEVLPVESEMKAYVNGQEASIISTTVKTNFVTADASESTITVEGTNAVKEYFFRGAAVNGMKAIIQKSGKVRIEALNGEHVDFDDSKYYFDISCIVKYAGVRYESTVKRFTLTEVTDATLYKLLLSANAISKDQGIYTPSTIDVKVQIIDNTGTSVKTAVWMNANSAVKVKYVNGPYEATSNLLDTMPAFSDVPTCITVVLIDTATNTVLDVESVPMTAVGRDGAGQPWVQPNFDSFVVDCDWQNKVIATTDIDVVCRLYWGDALCTLDDGACYIELQGGYDDTPDSVTNEKASKRFTFNQGDTLMSTYVFATLMGTASGELHTASLSIPVIANVHGQKGEKGDAGASVRFLGDWKDGDFHVWNATFRDCVKHNRMYWLVNVASGGTVLLGEPTESNTNWENIGAMRFVATELLLAESGTINLLSSNVLNMYNGAYKTASLNSDGAGAYIVYYPSGKKMMQMASDGYWRYFNDDDGNTERWKLGFGGAIEMNNADSWPEVYLAPSALDVEFNRNDTFTLNEYHTFKSGSSGQWKQWNGYYFDSVPTNTNPATPQGANYLNGVYIASGVVLEELGESVNDNRLYVELLHINNGELQQRIIRYKNNDGTYTNVITSGQI